MGRGACRGTRARCPATDPVARALTTIDGWDLAGRAFREPPGHRVSSAHFQAAYPAVAEAGLGSRGVYIGSDLHGGSFVFDPWILYARGILGVANTIVLGMPDYGKSSLTKSWLYRSRVFGRRCEIVDPKGEYTDLVQALGGVVLHLTPGGQTTLNPLTPVGSRELRESLLLAVSRAMLDRALSQAEALGVIHALTAADKHQQTEEVCVSDVVRQLRDPCQDTLDALDMGREQARDALREVSLALLRLCHGPLRGMFDAPTSVAGAFDARCCALTSPVSRPGPGVGRAGAGDHDGLRHSVP